MPGRHAHVRRFDHWHTPVSVACGLLLAASLGAGWHSTWPPPTPDRDAPGPAPVRAADDADTRGGPYTPLPPPAFATVALSTIAPLSVLNQRRTDGPSRVATCRCGPRTEAPSSDLALPAPTPAPTPDVPAPTRQRPSPNNTPVRVEHTHPATPTKTATETATLQPTVTPTEPAPTQPTITTPPAQTTPPGLGDTVGDITETTPSETGAGQ